MIKYQVLQPCILLVDKPGTGKMLEAAWQQKKVMSNIRGLGKNLEEKDVLELEVVNSWKLDLDPMIWAKLDRNWQEVICFEVKGAINGKKFAGELVGYDLLPNLTISDQSCLQSLA